ncbi:hypothetical protein QZJ86_12060 [Methylomonas montana]|uniref:hypothetical protein n=1 Tax=Methylomonas montana TaxID=3058963 RepID=UPI002657B42F|nr:hypothetical protein [Methylomonas montana]WKJ88756.1 hypothetical protein QZJ86_12060 [Methylomonas montana]
MPSVRTIRTSFVGGEVSPEMYGRLDLAKEQSGLKLCKNFQVLPHGPIQNRPGLRYVNAVKNATVKTRLIPFSFSNSQTFAIELGAGYFRFHTLGATLMNGGVPYEIGNTYAAADLMDIHYVQSGDIITLTHPSYPPLELRRYANLNWTLTGITFQSKLASPSGASATATYPTAGTPQSFQYIITALDSYGLEESMPSTATAAITNDLTITGNYNTITWTGVSGASRYNVYKSTNGAYGYIGQTVNASFEDKNILADLTQTPPLTDTVFTSAGNYPAAVGYYEQRRFFGGSNNQPQNLWGTQSGTESNMNYSVPSKENDALRVRIAAQRANYIRHIVSLLDMIVMTASTEWRVFSASGNALAPTTITIKAQSQNGASNVQPVAVNNTVVYAQSQGGHVRELAYQWQASGYQSNDLCLLATHLFNGFNIVDMAFSRSPYPIVWVVNDQGKLLGLTYLPDQQVAAWHQHTTDGFFESICTVTEGNYDVLYAVVRRTINGVTTRYIEMLDNRQFAKLEDAFFVDCGLSTFNPINYLTGLEGNQATRMIQNYTKSPVQKGTMQIRFDGGNYNAAYTGTVAGTVSGIDQASLYRVDVFSTTDIDYAQGSSAISYSGGWSVAGVHTGAKTARLVRIADGAIIAEIFFGNGLARSYEVPPNDPVYPVLKDRCFLYDQALAIVMAVCNRSGVANSNLPGYLMDGLKVALDASMAASATYILGPQPVVFSVNYKSGNPPDIYVRNGATAWVLYAMAFYAANMADGLRTWIPSYIDQVAAQLLQYKAVTYVPTTTTPINPLQAGAIMGGIGKYSLPDYLTFTNTPVTWCSTEHNIDSYFALALAGAVRGNATYTAAAQAIGTALVTNFWDAANGRFYQGIGASGVDTSDALDCHSWGSLFLRAFAAANGGNATYLAMAASAYAGVDAYATYDAATGVAGYRPYLPSRGYPNTTAGVWGEGTLGVILARVAAGDTARAVADYNQLLAIAGPNGLPYSTIRDYVYELSDWPSVASTSWLIIAAHPDGFWGVTTNIDTTIIAQSSAVMNQPMTTIAGLSFLEGKTVSILADGIVHRPLKVASGTITLDFPASKVTVGLPIDAKVETLPIALAGDAALGQGRIKNVNQVWARCVDFVGASIGPTDQDLVPISPLQYETDSITPKLANGEFRIKIMPKFNPEGGVVLSEPNPLPITVVDITTEVAIGG